MHLYTSPSQKLETFKYSCKPSSFNFKPQNLFVHSFTSKQFPIQNKNKHHQVSLKQREAVKVVMNQSRMPPSSQSSRPNEPLSNFIGPVYPSTKDAGQYYSSMYKMSQPKRSTVPHATVLEETSELPKVWSQQKLFDTSLIFQHSQQFEDLFIGRKNKEMKDQNQQRDFKFQVWHNQNFMNKEMREICSDIIENYQDIKFKEDKISLNLLPEEKNVIRSL